MERDITPLTRRSALKTTALLGTGLIGVPSPVAARHRSRRSRTNIITDQNSVIDKPGYYRLGNDINELDIVADNVKLDGANKLVENHVRVLNSKNVSLGNFTLDTDEYSGVFSYDSSNIFLKNIHTGFLSRRVYTSSFVSGLTITNCTGGGVELRNSEKVRIRNCDFIADYETFTMENVVNSVVLGSKIRAGSDWVTVATLANCRNITIIRNSITQGEAGHVPSGGVGVDVISGGRHKIVHNSICGAVTPVQDNSESLYPSTIRDNECKE